MKSSVAIFFFLILFFSGTCRAQKVSLAPTLEPAFAVAEEPLKITYDVTGTPLQSLDEAWLWLWLPDHNSAEIASNISPASRRPAVTNRARLARETGMSGEVRFSIEIVLTAFTHQPKDAIKTVGMLLKGNDWADGQTTDFLFQTTDGFTLAFNSPKGRYGFYEAGDMIDIEAVSSEMANIDLFVDEKPTASAMNVSALRYRHSVIADGRVHAITAVAANAAQEPDTVRYHYALAPVAQEAAVPGHLKDGINYDPADPTKASLVLTAPGKDFVFVIGSFNDWSIAQNDLMKKDGDRFWLEVEGLEVGKEYLFQYLVDGAIRIADPYAEKIASPFDDGQIIAESRYQSLMPYPAEKTSEAASYLQTHQADFTWADFTPPDKAGLIIYELLVRDFTEKRSFNGALERLDYLESLGINALELMPVMEFEGNISWGYNPSSMLAVDKYYGAENELKTLINECHKRGIAVILDIVLNHQFGRSALVRLHNEGVYGAPTANNPWFNATPRHDFNVGYDMNHESEYTAEYVKRAVSYWIDEYNIDGYRFDLSKGFTQKNTLGSTTEWSRYDVGRVRLWKEMADFIWSISPDAYIILEHFADNDEEKELADYGMMLWGNLNHTYISALGGSGTSIDWLYHGSRGWGMPHVVGYMESHDEERQIWSLIQNGWTLSEALQRAKLGAAFFFTVPGPKMLWQFGELGYDEELNNDRLGIKPTHWEYVEDENRYALLEIYRSLIHLRTRTDYIKPEYFNWSPAGKVKWIAIESPEVNFYIIGNFDRKSRKANHQFPKPGMWHNYFSGQQIEVTDPNSQVNLSAGQFCMFTDKLIDNYIDSNPIPLGSKAEVPAMHIYPNPANEKIQVRSPHPPDCVSILSLTGKLMLKAAKPEAESIDLSTLPAGIYIAEIKIGSEKIIKKIIKKS